jgi:hypothetical protein
MVALPSELRGRAGEGRRRLEEYLRALPARTRGAGHRPEIIALAAIPFVGLILRLLFIVQWRPALVGYPDTTIYVQDARAGIFDGPLRVGGYSEFLRLLHDIRPHLSFAILVQHMLGLASGLLLFGAVRRAGFPRGLGLVPAAVVILGARSCLSSTPHRIWRIHQRWLL